MAKYGLIGKNIGYSFSKAFFTTKFSQENRTDTYQNFDIASIESLKDVIQANETLKGVNVTIPYKESVIPLLDRIDKEAKKIGAINTIKIHQDGSLVGYNTDHYGFAKALADFLPLKEKSALILGTGGASKAVSYVLDAMNYKYQLVSRTKTEMTLSYDELNEDLISNHLLIINCTPLGTFPKTQEFPDIPYQYLSKDHLLFDLIYI